MSVKYQYWSPLVIQSSDQFSLLKYLVVIYFLFSLKSYPNCAFLCLLRNILFLEDGLGGKPKALWSCVMATVWVVWMEWDKWIFENNRVEVKGLWGRISFSASWCASLNFWDIKFVLIDAVWNLEATCLLDSLLFWLGILGLHLRFIWSLCAVLVTHLVCFPVESLFAMACFIDIQKISKICDAH